MKTYLFKITIETVATYHRTNGSINDKFISADDKAHNLLIYGSKELNISPWDYEAFSQAMTELNKLYESDTRKDGIKP